MICFLVMWSTAMSCGPSNQAANTDGEVSAGAAPSPGDPKGRAAADDFLPDVIHDSRLGRPRSGR